MRRVFQDDGHPQDAECKPDSHPPSTWSPKPYSCGWSSMPSPKNKAPGSTKLRAPERQTRINAFGQLPRKRKCELRYAGLFAREIVRGEGPARRQKKARAAHAARAWFGGRTRRDRITQYTRPGCEGYCIWVGYVCVWFG